ncbi:hypothetical protein FRC07_011407 [Ceratobasidium sp. 392]|nr:hypothetical protein FRC07_011407 [Ceratobasidium sp. 392]
MSRAVASEALHNSGEAMTDTNSLYDLYKAILHPSFVTPKVETETDSSFLVRVLWDDRASFLKLCINGLLPGCSLLLLTISALLTTTPEHRDRKTLQLVFAFTLRNRVSWDHREYRFTSMEDIHTISRAYAGLLYVCQQDTPSADTFTAELMRHMNQFVFETMTLGPDPSSIMLDYVDIAWASLQFLWLFFDREEFVSISEQHNTLVYAVHAFSFVSRFSLFTVSSAEETRAYARILQNSDIISLFGRFLLNTTRGG